MVEKLFTHLLDLELLPQLLIGIIHPSNMYASVVAEVEVVIVHQVLVLVEVVLVVISLEQ